VEKVSLISLLLSPECLHFSGSSMCVHLAGGCYALLYIHTIQAEACSACMQSSVVLCYVYPATSAATATVRSEQTRSVVCRKSPYAVIIETLLTRLLIVITTVLQHKTALRIQFAVQLAAAA
jgi:hypothetical protein